MTDNYQKLQNLLSELFEFDKADLDFGIYRIMNQKREEVARFLKKDLLPQVKETLQEAQSTSSARLQQELEEAIEQLEDLEMDPDESPKVRQLRERIGDPEALEALEDEVFSRLHNFFSRYYKEGDFISLRRYKEGVYAIPYEGEEVKLHWANHDQYYIKTSEYFSDYTFELPDERRVHFRIEEAASERDNNIPLDDTSRRFVLADEDAISEEDGELVIRFHYKPVDTKQWQSTINAEIAETITEADATANWKAQLETLRPTDANPDRTVLDRHLDEYTARNTFDYFIHKDLKGFLRRELDFYIKSEVLHLDDIEGQTAVRVEQQLGKIRALRSVAHKIIDFLAQLEDFQKRLWLKKKFIVDTQYCITLDQVPEELYPEVFANEDQIEEWRELYGLEGLDELRSDEETTALAPVVANQNLIVDTGHFTDDFRDRILADIGSLDEVVSGLLVHGENHQALLLLNSRYSGRVECVYIDPPYNADTSEILYKNGFKHSSWLALMENRLSAAQTLYTDTGSLIVAIDENEQERLGLLLDGLLPSHERVCVTVIHNKKGIQGDYFSYNNEFAYFVMPPALSSTNLVSIPEDEWEYSNLRNWGAESLRSDAKTCFYPIYVRDGEIAGVGDVCPEDFHPTAANVPQEDGTIAVYPIDREGTERKWRYGRDSIGQIIDVLQVRTNRSGVIQIFKPQTHQRLKTVWSKSQYIAGDYGTRVLTDMGFPKQAFTFPKSVFTVRDCIAAVSGQSDIVCDFFAGSGTTAHSVINLNREDGGNRKYILVEMGEYFDTVMLPRVKKAIYSDEWRNGKPASPEGTSHVLKYIRLESYEDTLNNLELDRTEEQQQTLNEADASVREEYMLGYMLDIEARGSQSLLNVEAFRKPFDYTLNISTGVVGETTPMTVDLVETFNYLIGLTVRSVRQIDSIRVVEGTTPDGERTLVLWRDLDEVDNDELDEWFEEQGFAAPDAPYDLIYVNGDNNLGRLRPSSQTWNVRLIDDDFHRLMFDVQDEWS